MDRSESVGKSPHGRVEVYVPAATNALDDIEGGVKSKNHNSPRSLDIQERDFLFFDEELQILIVAEIPRQYHHHGKESPRPEFEIKVDAWAEDRATREAQTPQSQVSREQSRDLVDSTTISRVSVPMEILDSERKDGARDEHVLLAWRASVSIRRPKLRMVEPVITLSPSATLRFIDEVKPPPTSIYLRPFEPLEANALEPLWDLVGSEADYPYLATSRLEKTLPKQSMDQQKLQLSSHPTEPFRVHPATLVRLRLSPDHALSASRSMIASVDIDIVPFIPVTVVIEDAHLSAANGVVQPMMSDFLPFNCSAKDSITVLYKLYPDGMQKRKWLTKATSGKTAAGLRADFLTVSIVLEVSISTTTKTRIKMEWAASVDLTSVEATPINTVLGSSRPPTHEGPSLLPSAMKDLSIQGRTGNTANQRLVVTFSAPEKPIHVGQVFEWKIMLLNWTTGPIRLALIPIPRMFRTINQAQHFAKRHAPKASTVSLLADEHRHTRDGNEPSISQAIVDENVVYAMQHSNAMPPEADLIALTSEIRIGPLGVGQCHECTFEMIAFKAGVLRVDIVRIVNLAKEGVDGLNAPGVITDIRDLPDVVVID